MTASPPRPSPAIEAVVFDLGGVLAKVSGVATMRELSRLDSDEEMWRRWLTCRWVRDFERGQCSPDTFAAGVVNDWELTVEPAEFLTLFSGWVNQPYDGAGELVEEVAERCTVACLSNMNPIHWDDTISAWPFIDRLEHAFLSHRLGMVKPDREIYDHVVSVLGLPADRILFIDDNQLNVDGALDAGLVATRVNGVGEARNVIEAALRCRD
jgi:putative hydrolase of the HAD superfamily